VSIDSGKNYISLKNVGKVFPKSGEVLKNLTIDVQESDFVVLLGPSGSGKSTILRLIAGLDQSTTGRISFSKENKFETAFVFQESHLMPWRTLLENVELPLELMNISKNERRERATQLLNQVGLADAFDLYPAELSGGMKMRASLARALVVKPKLLLLDEPFAALDEQTRFKLSEELRLLWQERAMTVIFVTHSVQEACFLADRIIALSNKPTKIQADIRLDLPVQRFNSLRTESIFLQQLKKIYASIN
jgi:NitT/TauT family transport system ATP-binding protein